jgi:assimilatory nitrate reductase catalytic subunit
MFAEVGRRMGWEDAFGWQDPADVFREHAALSAFENNGARLFNLGGLADISDSQYDELPPMQWPVPKPGGGVTGSRLFARGGFSTPDGKARMVPLKLPVQDDAAGASLILNTGRIRDQWHTMTRTGRVPHLMAHIPAPSVAVHPRDAALRGLTDKGLARIESDHGSVVMRVSLDEGVRPGDVFAPMHWSDQFTSSGPIDRLVHAVTDPVSGQPDLKGTKVRITAIAESWRGHLLRLGGGEPELSEALWWSKAPVANGFAFELAGWHPLQQEVHSEGVLRRLLRISADAELVSYSDPRKAMFRYAGILHGRLEACVFFGPSGADFAGVDQAKALLGREISTVERIALLAGTSGNGAKSAGKIVCSCFSVSQDTILAAIQADGLTSPAQIGARLKAGTNCGSCIPELKKLLQAVPALDAAE